MLDIDLWNRVWDLNKFRTLCVRVHGVCRVSDLGSET
ncbi:hypothetical protein SLEP1_g54798 [Rubroshorea leprosula]|uniref:Uncharacterized protein n=1 Tax=Rubroshorea leprosula TaxID=152421 RepID=A0AAV5MG24_9ROSI|nr:hypothetical protein SLEP1_g54798 [Rubroshorea leprosula]